eukprot:CAMPEP_0198138924 /NCGR_PEP_ID=MMETSP1443-20131203/2291_1 /TAXON_ID=186043 /ORGANISM="Entomoneis sp., Strain CCMP2396" /LENGTH=1220 /DNA_ID=CAMNT_0043800881 /DNA_START=48 /DNA_END=3710 /DNA_ORIENTATION=-
MEHRSGHGLWLMLSILASFGNISAVSSFVSVEQADGKIELPPADEALQKNTVVNHGKSLVDWVQSKGGFVNPKLEIRPSDLSDPQTSYEMFTNEDIKEDELLFDIPRELLITDELEVQESDWICATAENLAREMKLGNGSRYAPYVNYLDATKPGQLPSHWSDSGKQLLYDVIGQPDEQILPPVDSAGWLDTEWKEECDGGDDELEQRAFLLVLQRGWDEILIPIYDLLNHRNGKWMNTKSLGVRKESVKVVASKLIPAGDQVYSTYDNCEDCGGRAGTYGTPEILRDYGFVEEFPQTWIFHDQGVAFKLDEEDGELQLKWIKDEPEEDELGFFDEQIERLTDIYNSKLTLHLEGVLEYEQETVKEYTGALIAALEKMVGVVRGFDCATSEGTCSVSSGRYDDLDKRYSDYDITTCDRGVSLDYTTYEIIDNVESHYQLQEWIKDPVSSNVCFDLDDIYQQCTSYRPHYHEVFVHYTARFLPEIKRVLWVGGGDSMLLHEILKYPSLEVVFGLELDQKVTRWSFKHFGSQPHWDNEKVQWWYGDAAKSLLMLPKEYFGSFDLVLVDLSETVMSAKVTKELDIMAALSLLLKPNGIFVKNELYFEKLNSLFKHTIQINYYDVPAICSQTMVFGSNAVDFVHANLTDHGIETLLAPLDKLDENFDIVHDYMSNPLAKRHCKGPEEEKEPEEQEASPGIVLILEAENASADMSTPEKVENLIVPALEKQGLGVIETVKSDSNEAVLVTVFTEGYVVARTFPENKHCAFDIHIWSSFDKLEGIKSALIAAVGSGSESSSSFRIVAGGMFGVSSWVKDSMSRGPEFTQECNDPVQPALVKPMDDATIAALVQQVTSWWSLPETFTATVICGPESKECNGVNSLKSSGIKNVVPVYTCSSMEGGVEYLENSADLMYACEQEIIEMLETSLNADVGKIGVIVVDPSASFQMLQIVDKIVSRKHLRSSLLMKEGPLVVAPIIDSSETWRTHFVDGFRELYETSPADTASLVFNSTESSIQIAIFFTGDEYFITHMNEFVAGVEEDIGLRGEIRFIGGGHFDWQGNHWKPSQFFSAGAYDQTGPFQQWKSQQPTGHQSVMQLMTKKSELSKEGVKSLVESTLTTLGIETTTSEFTSLGDGSAIVAVWSGGNVIVLYDGRSNVSINLFTYEQDPEFAKKFSNNFKKLENSLDVVLYDEMPRGYGRVVNWSNDIGARDVPHWALHLVEQVE